MIVRYIEIPGALGGTPGLGGVIGAGAAGAVCASTGRVPKAVTQAITPTRSAWEVRMGDGTAAAAFGCRAGVKSPDKSRTGGGSEFQHGVDLAAVLEAGTAVQGEEFDEDGDARDFDLGGLADELDAGFECAAGGEEVVDDEYAFGLGEGIGVDLKAVSAVFKGVLDAVHGAGEFAGLADGHEAGRERLGHGDAEDESPGFGADDHVHAHAAVGVGHEFHGEGEALAVGKEGREVLEDDAGLGEVRDVDDECAEFVHGAGLPGGCGEASVVGGGVGGLIGFQRGTWCLSQMDRPFYWQVSVRVACYGCAAFAVSLCVFDGQ